MNFRVAILFFLMLLFIKYWGGAHALFDAIIDFENWLLSKKPVILMPLYFLSIKHEQT